MKTIPLVYVAMLAATASVRSQDQDTASRESITAPAASVTTARILGDLPDGTPPLPEVPKPEFIVPAKDILSTTTHEQGGRTITIQRIKPIELPPPPPPAPTTEARDDSAFRARLAQYHASHPKSEMLCFGATVYRSKDSPPRTLATYWPVGNSEPVTFWSSADFALIAGIYKFVGTDGQTRSLFMSWSSVDLDSMPDSLTQRGYPFSPPNIPELSDKQATFTVVGKQPTAEDIVPIQSLHDLYNHEFLRLKTAYEGREQARLQQEAELKANPPQPKDITLRFWRSERPAPAKGGAK